ncbi:MAG: methyltransferase domain-containing protein, partial [Pseudomonadota bacterium]
MSETPNAAEKEVWSGQRGQSWIDYEVEQDSLLSGAGEVVLAEAAPSVGARVLDIGCGTGALTLLMAEAVGREGHVLATDISEPLLTRAAERAASLEQVSTHLGDAQVTEWPEAGFDFAVS